MKNKKMINQSVFTLCMMILLFSCDELPPDNGNGIDVTVTVDFSSPFVINNLETGVNLIQSDEIVWQNEAQNLVGEAMEYTGVHIMGWGSDNPEPSPGEYNWGSLDHRVQYMRDTGSTMMITLCCAPDWMKGGQTGETDWSQLEVAPLPEHFEDFANLAKEVALRYNDVEYFQVWNELKGFWNHMENRWDYEGYTGLYNEVYTSIKSVRPDAKIGGPYVIVFQDDPRTFDVISYWLDNKIGADFIVVDGGPLLPNTAEEEFENSQYFIDVVDWIRQQPNGGGTLPIGWAEWYPWSLGDSSYSADHFNAIIANHYVATMKSGSDYILMWGAEGDSEGYTSDYADPFDAGNPLRILTNTAQPTAVHESMKNFKNYFPAGTQLYTTTISDPSQVEAIASTTHAALVNKTNGILEISINGEDVTLSAYEVKFVPIQEDS